MTILEAIQRVDRVKANDFTVPEKIQWLDTIERTIKTEIVDIRRDSELISFDGYGDNTDQTTVLIAPDPYSELYVLYLMAQIDFFNEEFSKYNNILDAFHDTYDRFRNYYNRLHPVRGKKFKYFRGGI